jgi:hypothetical protein
VLRFLLCARQNITSNCVSQVEGRFQLPKLEKWRVTDTVGVQLDDPSSHIVRANFFHTPIKNIPKEIFHYNISIFRSENRKIYGEMYDVSS